MTHYPHFDVMDHQEAWDPHTREIVKKRLGPPSPCRFLKSREQETLLVIARHLLAEDRQELLEYVLSQVDQTLTSPYGEGQREAHLPPACDLVRRGLLGIDQVARERRDEPFVKIDPDHQFSILADLQLGHLESVIDWNRCPQKPLFQKLLDLCSEAYYSHPQIWSEIGYGGPAYPRGYLRIELGLTDPWEARDHE